MSCSACHRDLKIIARGYCRACYQRWLKRGTTEYAPPRHRTFCHIDDCGKPVVTNGMCDMHRQRLIKTGSVEKSDWGVKTRHPLYHSWKWMMRHRGQHPVDDRWHDFLQFVVDVKERPTAKHKLFAANDLKPIGPENYVWKEAVTQKVDGEDDRTYANRARRVFQALRKEAFQGYELKKRFGVSKDAYDNMLAQQDGTCAICHEVEKSETRNGRMALAIDHCHTHGNIRGLLCAKCNRGLGLFGDDVARLRAAADYIEKHTLPPPPE